MTHDVAEADHYWDRVEALMPAATHRRRWMPREFVGRNVERFVEALDELKMPLDEVYAALKPFELN